MNKHILTLLLTLCAGALHADPPARGLAMAGWQFSVGTTNLPDQHHEHQRAFLWIPPGCKYVRGIILGQQVILEENFLTDPIIREAATRENLAIILFSPFNFGYTINDAAWGKIQRALDDLASVSGYDEIARAPLLTVGHSGGGIWAWNIPYHVPKRTFGLVTIKSAALKPPEYEKNASVDHIPTLSVSGQYETWGVAKNPQDQMSAETHWRWLRGDLLSMRGHYLCPLQSELVDPGVTHFGWNDDLARYIAMFIEKAAHYRIPPGPPPAGQPPMLVDLKQEDGWLTDCTFLTPSRYAPAPYKEYTGDPYLAMWQMDGELARAIDNYRADQRGKKLQMVTFLDHGQPLQPAWIEGIKPEPIGDGMTVKVSADFVKETPPELSFPKRSLGHAPGPIHFKLIGGWGGGNEQVGPDTFRLKMGPISYIRGMGSLMIMAWHPGDAEYAYCEQPVSIGFPGHNDKGTKQTITFPAIAPVKVGTPSIKLEATTDTGRPVEYFVLSGPAEVRGDKTLVLAPIPPRAKYPVKVTVVAYQWGSMTEPLFQTATPVEQTVEIQQ